MSGNLHLGDFFSNRKEPGRVGLPIMSVTMNDSLVLRDDLERRTESALRPDQHLLVRKGDIAYNMMRMWQGACGLATADCIVSPAYVVLVPKPDIDSRFAYHWFKSSRMIHLFWAYSYGLTEDRLRLYFDEFAEIPASPPSLEQQRRIVAVLDAWDRAIEQTERLIAAKRRRWQTLISEMSANKWTPMALGKLGRWVGGGTPSKSNSHYWTNGSIPWVSPKDMAGWQITSAEDFITADAVAGSSTQMIPPGSVLVVTRSGILRTRVPVAVTKLQVAINQDIKALIPKNPDLGPLIAALLLAASERFRQETMKTGTTVESIDLDGLKAFKLSFPTSDDDIVAAKAVLVQGLNEIDSLDRIRASFQIQKRGLMQKLLASDWRLGERFDPPMPAPRAVSVGGAA